MGHFRIIAGEFRRRQLSFPNEAGLRPTTDRTRETVFNWLTPFIHSANSLDAFAGTGALGFEALSRGAKQVVMIEKNVSLTKQLSSNAKQLDCEDKITIIKTSFFYGLEKIAARFGPFDIVFLDPPFYKNFGLRCCQQLIEANALSKEALVYLETEKKAINPSTLTDNVHIIKQMATGHVDCFLMRQ